MDEDKVVSLNLAKRNSEPIKVVENMPVPKYKRNDVVALNSGGIPMTVQDYKFGPNGNSNDDRIDVLWMDDMGTLQRDTVFSGMVRPFPDVEEEDEEEVLPEGELDVVVDLEEPPTKKRTTKKPPVKSSYAKGIHRKYANANGSKKAAIKKIRRKTTKR
jgi:uncharacterized protein YodC (DUF2158 family)